MNKFSEYLTERGIYYESAAEALRTSKTTIGKWARGESVPTPDSQADIRVWTGGKVVESDWPPQPVRRNGQRMRAKKESRRR